MTNFDFKQWADLYQLNPDLFEQCRTTALNQHVAAAPPERRHSLEQTLFRINAIGQSAKNPLHSAIESSKLMWEYFGKLQTQLEHLEQKLLCLSPTSKNNLRLIRHNKK